MTKPPLNYFGGKTRIADRIADLLPPHRHYLEPFAGSMAVLFAKSPSKHETVNDIDGQLMAFWRVLRDRPSDLIRACALTPHCREELEAAFTDSPDEVEDARRIWVRFTQGRSGVKSRTGWRQYVDPSGTNTSMPRYLTAYVDRLATCAERLQGVSLESRPATDLIERFGKISDVLIYADPPYIGSTRRGGRYTYEMTGEVDHQELIDSLLACKASVVLSGYASSLYDEALGTWDRVEIPTVTGMGGGSSHRLEVLWSNRPISHPHLFSEASASC